MLATKVLCNGQS